MDYTPKTEKDLRENMLLPPGLYNFEVVEALEKQSKKGNDMIELNLRIFVDDGTTRLLKDWLVPGSDLGDLKLNRFAHATGLEQMYFSSDLTALACVGAVGEVRVTIEGNDDYGDQNRIKDYVPVDRAKPPVETAAKPVGVPAQQTRRANKKKADANSELSQVANGEQGYDPDIPF